MSDKPVQLTLGCARFLVGVMEQEIELLSDLVANYQGRLDELNEAIKAAEQKDSKNG
jgi:hypothetical protein